MNNKAFTSNNRGMFKKQYVQALKGVHGYERLFSALESRKFNLSADG